MVITEESTHPYKINFIFTTYVKTSEKVPNISCFNLNYFPDILSQLDVDDTYWMKLLPKKLCRKFNKVLDIQLQDLSAFNYNETIIECTLWEKHDEDVHFYVKNNKTGLIILLGSFMRTKKYTIVTNLNSKST
ncbi:hypothetical protein IGI04_006644 [Brassica rapa subsp. trilocularis]|uniref:F-box associated domain-containing protein n=1 Tax=Brassica rapa subsp. trilocularis TaxID=1813537 RepID=A0ABQ7NHI4_BRACM|nr:hypothetical protein IGI04_006644 [Brassica rapa subsp. trilocularis]